MNNKKHNFKHDDKLLCSEQKYDKIIEKPTLIAFGKGNGKTTITNLKKTGPKGPIKTLAKELSKLTTVILNLIFYIPTLILMVLIKNSIKS